MSVDADEIARLRARLRMVELTNELLTAVDNHDLRDRPARILRMLIRLAA